MQAKAPEALITLQNVSKQFGSYYAVREFNFQFMPDERVGFVGPNGAGKSTVLGILGGWLKPSSGTVQFDIDPGSLGAILPQGLYYGQLSAHANLELTEALIPRGWPRISKAQALREVGLSKAVNKPLETYSRGMRQRFLWARALYTRPFYLLLDEPFTGLDEVGIKQAKNWLLAGGDANLDWELRGFALIDHDLRLVHDLVDSVYVLREGSLANSASTTSTDFKYWYNMLQEE